MPQEEAKVPFREVLPKKGLLFTESQSQMVLCKPKLLPLKSFTLQKLEKMQNEAKERARDQLREDEEAHNNPGPSDAPYQSESVSFE